MGIGGLNKRNDENDGNVGNQGGNAGNYFSDQSLKNEIIKVKRVKPILEKL